MISIENTLVSEDLLKKKFVCDLAACKGACCVQGDSGAPLESDETAILDEIYPHVEPYLSEEGKSAIEQQGKWITDSDGDLVTPLVNNGPCAYVIFENDTAICAIEKAHANGTIDFKKPISCHLYPVRITSYKFYEAVNYHHWDICEPACKCGKALKVPVFRFLKEPLIRKYGSDWYDQLLDVSEALSDLEAKKKNR